jgi:hypothetical protein
MPSRVFWTGIGVGVGAKVGVGGYWCFKGAAVGVATGVEAEGGAGFDDVCPR